MGGDKQGSSLETKHSCVGEGKGLFGLFFEMFALNKVHWCLKKNHQGLQHRDEKHCVAFMHMLEQ